ncbi:ankyrin repeat domain-containing protein [Flavicella sediminum]|uniref:ankyrin repeat domain-containing protein n=1 Tax=Flavicella sediminum TaxID=2585141 RepID=UPI00111FF8B1|nr:ankyrin repeat domain-containing protein [Flavicella sediminum]
MKTKILIFLLLLPLAIFAQRGQKSDNAFHNRSFWQTKPTVETVKQKIKEGHDAVTPNKAAFDAICYAIMAKAPVKTIEYLLSLPGNNINKPTHDGRSYLMWAGSAGDIAVMKLLLKKGADTKVVGSHGFTWFTFTVNAGHENTAIYDLMIANGVDVKETNRAGANAILLMAGHSKDGKIISYFEKKGLDVKAEDNKGNNLLFYAAQRGNIALIKKYIQKGFNYKKINSEGENLVLFASHGARGYSNSLTVYEYLATLGLDFTSSNKNEQNALHFLASNAKEIAVVDFFIAKGIAIHQKDKEGNTPFLNAARGHNQVILKKLMTSVSNINQKNKEGFSAITFATQRINGQLFSFLEAKGADLNVVDADGNNLYYHLFTSYSRRTKADFELLVRALEKAKVPFEKASKNTSPLHIAVEKGDEKLILKALELGAEINKKNTEGLTPLHLAAMKANNVSLLKMLLSKGADKNMLTDFEESAYDLAIENELLKKQKLDIKFLKQS